MRAKCFVLFFLLILPFVNIRSQNPIRFDTIIAINSNDSAQIRANIEIWMKMNGSGFSSDKSTTSSNGQFYHKYGSSLRWGNHYGNISYNVIAEFKSDRLRISSGGFTHKAENSLMGISLDYGLVTDSEKPVSGLSKKYWEEIKKACKIRSFEVFKNISEAIDKSENW